MLGLHIALRTASFLWAQDAHCIIVFLCFLTRLTRLKFQFWTLVDCNKCLTRFPRQRCTTAIHHGNSNPRQKQASLFHPFQLSFQRFKLWTHEASYCTHGLLSLKVALGEVGGRQLANAAEWNVSMGCWASFGVLVKVPLATWFVVFVCVCVFSPSFCCFTTLRCCQCPIAQGESRNRSLVIYSLRRCVLKRRFPETPKGFISRNTSPYSNLYIQTYSYSYFKSTAVFHSCVSLSIWK